jgi:hypothetical protein
LVEQYAKSNLLKKSKMGMRKHVVKHGENMLSFFTLSMYNLLHDLPNEGNGLKDLVCPVLSMGNISIEINMGVWSWKTVCLFCWA